MSRNRSSSSTTNPDRVSNPVRVGGGHTSNFDFLLLEWQSLHEDALQAEANARAAPRTCAFYARRFDLLMLNLQLAILEKSPKQARFQCQVRTLANNLEEKKSIPLVSEHLTLILDLQTDEYWQNVTLPMLERVRKKLRDLIKFIDRQGGRENVYTDFEDALGEGIEVEGISLRDPSFKEYRLKVEKLIRENRNHITIKRLKMNEPITDFHHQGVTGVLPDLAPAIVETIVEVNANALAA